MGCVDEIKICLSLKLIKKAEKILIIEFISPFNEKENTCMSVIKQLMYDVKKY